MADTTGSPEFRLHRIDEHDDCCNDVEIMPVGDVRGETSLGRREVFRAGLTAAAALGLLAACSSDPPATPPPTTAPPTTPSPTPTTTTPPPTTPPPAVAPVPVPRTTSPPPRRTTTPRRTTQPPRTRTSTRTRTDRRRQPCGQKIPPGYVCTCNCVAGG